MTQEEAEKLLDELLAVETGLSGWEMDFLESLDGQRGGVFSEKQIAVLERIESRLL
mgnify:FL=1